MKAATHNHFAQSLNALLKRYSLSEAALSALKEIDEDAILSLAYTDSGGFDLHSGTYYPEEREINYKVKIDYLAHGSENKKTLVLLPVANGEV